MAAITGFSHVGIHVAELERSIRFYEGLGLVLHSRRTRAEPYLRDLVGYPGATLEVALMEVPGSTSVLEIIEYRDVDRSVVEPVHANPGTTHFCLLVGDLEVVHRRLMEAGVRFLSEVQTPTAGPNEGGRVVYLLDPDGIRVELLQTSRRMTGAPLSRA
jgi:lactoylglutathione lyase